MRMFVIPETFFKSIAENGKLYSRIWFYWLSEYVDKIFDSDFIDNQEKEFTQISEIREIYQLGIQLLQQDGFRIEVVKGKKKQRSKPVGKDVKLIAEQAIEYLNAKCGTTYLASGTNLALIADRIKDGFTLSDFKVVIDKKVDDWKGNEMQDYLRPITLFSKKFENYLNGGAKGNTSDFGNIINSVERAKQLVTIRPVER